MIGTSTFTNTKESRSSLVMNQMVTLLVICEDRECGRPKDRLLKMFGIYGEAEMPLFFCFE